MECPVCHEALKEYITYVPYGDTEVPMREVYCPNDCDPDDIEDDGDDICKDCEGCGGICKDCEGCGGMCKDCEGCGGICKVCNCNDEEVKLKILKYENSLKPCNNCNLK